MNKDSNMDDIQLPPCRVCGGKSSGCHFGVISCESCKVFFRRSLQRESPYACPDQNSCVIKSGSRSSCSACRLNRCVSLGMSKTGVKKGRYSQERKTNYKVQLETLKTEAKLQQQEKDRMKKLRQEGLDKMAARLYDLHLQHEICSPEAVSVLRQREADEMKYKKLLHQVTGPLPEVSPDEVQEFYTATGIDISGYKEILKKCLVCWDTYSMWYIHYAKNLEEFMELTLSDRIAIMKASIFDWLLTSFFQTMNTEDKIFSCLLCKNVCTEEEFRFIGSSDDYEQVFRPFSILQQQNLHPEEVAVLRAFALFDISGTCECLEKRDQVWTIQLKLLDCLFHVIQRHHGADLAGKVYARIIHALTEMRTSEIMYEKSFAKIVKIFTDIKCTKVVAEVFKLPPDWTIDSQSQTSMNGTQEAQYCPQ